MYAYLKGKIEDIKKDYIVIDVNNVGYKVFMPNSNIEKLAKLQEVKIYTYLNVKEDEMSLYGFLTAEDLKTFEQLILVSGVGPKVGKAIVSTLGAETVCAAIATSNIDTLVRVSGVGNKMAQRIILELKDKITKEQLINEVDNKNINKIQLNIKDNKNIEEASFALKVLGYNTKQIDEAFQNMEINDESIEDIIKLALKYLSK